MSLKMTKQEANAFAFGGMNGARRQDPDSYPAFEEPAREVAWDANAETKRAIFLCDCRYTERNWGECIALTETAISALRRQLEAFKTLKAISEMGDASDEV